MKVLLKFSFLLVVLSLAFTSCKKAPKGEAAKTGEAANNPAKAAENAKSYIVENSQVLWTGTKVGGQHAGTIAIQKGELTAVNGTLGSGSFVLDMNSITNTDLEAGKGKEKLEGHLKNEDFFDVANHPTGTFKITSVTPLSGSTDANTSVTGDLTLKGITKSITFPTNILAVGNKISAVSPAFKINRTDWDIKYGSGLLGTAADKIIHDEISLVLNISASAK